MRIDDYAKSMFRFEEINAAWITRCAHYLTHIFGDVIQGSTVVDYAFGRGNWSLAFREAGAARVVAIDAAKSNVERFTFYLKAKSIDGIQVIEGNVLEDSIEVGADIIWAYGILHHIYKPKRFFLSLTSMWGDSDKGIGMVYAYNSSSLRQVVVELARQAIVYDSYDAFMNDSFLFSHCARMRARDDLTAPHVFWYSSGSLVKLLASAGAFAERSIDSFAGFEKVENAEFRPHCIIFSRDGPSRLSGESHQLGIDEQLIHEFGEAILSAAQPSMVKKFAVGLLNTHFDALTYHGYEKALLDDFLYLLYTFWTLKLEPKNARQELILEFSRQALSGITGNSVPVLLKSSLIATYLSSNAIRI